MFAGDFNSTPHSNTLHFLTEGTTTQQALSRSKPNRVVSKHLLRNQLGLTSAYANVGEPDFTCFTRPGVKVTCDYILYRSEMMGVSQVLHLDCDFVKNTFKQLPQPAYPSDHLALMAKLYIKTKVEPVVVLQAEEELIPVAMGAKSKPRGPVLFSASDFNTLVK